MHLYISKFGNILYFVYEVYFLEASTKQYMVFAITCGVEMKTQIIWHFQIDSELKNCSSSENVMEYPEKEGKKEAIAMDVIPSSEEKASDLIET